MFLYRVKYTESEYDIQNNDSLYKKDQQCQNTLVFGFCFRNFRKSIFFKSFDFKMISVLWRFSWPAFGGPKILVYIYSYIFIFLLFYWFIDVTVHYPFVSFIDAWIYRVLFSFSRFIRIGADCVTRTLAVQRAPTPHRDDSRRCCEQLPKSINQ